MPEATALHAGAGAPPEPGRCLLLTTNDSEANFDGPRIGAPGLAEFLVPVARVAGEKRRMQAQRGTGNVLLVEGGDVLQGRYLARADGNRAAAAAAALRLYERAGYDLGVLGNHEFDGGPRVLRAALEGLARYRLLVANLDAAGTSLDPATDKRAGERLHEATALVACGGMRVGFFGLLTPTTKTISDFGDVRFAADPLVGPARAAVAALRSQGADVVVALTHLGVGQDVDLALAVTGIDAIVGGHSHTALPVARRVGATWITQAGARFAHLGRLEFVRAAAGGFDPAQTTWRLDPIDAGMAADPAIVAAVDSLRATLVPERTIGTRAVPWDLTPPGLLPYAQRTARAMAAHATQATGRSIDGALMNLGGLRSATVYPAGPVTNVEVAAIHPFSNRLVVIELSGAQLRAVLEHVCSAAGDDRHGAGAVTWGISFRCDVARPPVRYVWQDNRPTAIAMPGERVVDATVGGRPLKPRATYHLATLDYLAKGGSGYFALTLGDCRCLDGQPFVPTRPCAGTPLLSDIIEQAVRAGAMDADLPK
ncbi:MAG: bifunctional metallophosphatase/5'-nucleotidase [Myxococcales bacterium]|nr:bifunctional metallophosphatase/5'-nucleotidase [Myxococcales bacterium]